MSFVKYLKDDMKPNPSFTGLALAVVTNIEDKENLGRVRVRILNRDDSKTETRLVRVLTPMSGAEWGMFFLPQVDDVVIIGFCDGDISKAYVLGSVWNENRKPPQKIENGENDIRMIKTRSGHSIVFNDKENKGTIEITSSTGLKIKIEDENSKITMGDKDDKNYVTIDSKNGKLLLKAENQVVLETGKSKITIDDNLKMESKGKIEAKAQTVKIKADDKFELEGVGGGRIKTSAKLDIDSPMSNFS